MASDDETEWREDVTAKLDSVLKQMADAWALLEEMLPKRTGLMGKMMKGKK